MRALTTGLDSYTFRACHVHAKRMTRACHAHTFHSSSTCFICAASDATFSGTNSSTADGSAMRRAVRRPRASGARAGARSASAEACATSAQSIIKVTPGDIRGRLAEVRDSRSARNALIRDKIGDKISTSPSTKYISPGDVHPVFFLFQTVFALFRPGGARATSEPAQREFLGVLFRKRSTFVQVKSYGWPGGQSS